MVATTTVQQYLLLEDDDDESTIKVVSDDDDESASSYCNRFIKKNNNRRKVLVVEKPQPSPSSSTTTTTTNNNNNNNKRRRLLSTFKNVSVRFSTKPNEIKYIPNRNDLSKEEIANCYITKQEYNLIKYDLTTTIKKMIQENLNPHEHDELRGLELYKNNGDGYYAIRKQNIKICRKELIYRQKYNEYNIYGHGHGHGHGHNIIDDEKWLLYNYRIFTKISVNRARIQGLQDQQLYDRASPPFHQIMER